MRKVCLSLLQPGSLEHYYVKLEIQEWLAAHVKAHVACHVQPQFTC